MSQKSTFILTFIFILLLGGFLRLWHIDFGLPHSFYADEPEFAELAIKYTFELKDIVTNNNWYKLVPISYVYGTVPTYFLTIFTVVFSKIASLFNIIYDKTTLYIYVRSVVSIFSLLLIPVIYAVYLKVFKDKVGALISAVLISLNWKLISHAHYVNADIFITILLAFSILFVFLYHSNEISKNNSFKLNTLYTILAGLFLGLSVGTKITTLITLPLYWYFFIKNKDYRSFTAFNFVIFGIFMITNPFSIIFAHNFVFRIYSMSIKEAGLVFDSVDLNPFKYLIGLSWISTLPVLLFSLFGIFKSLKNKNIKDFNIFFIGNILIYMTFYSLQTRRVDRWLLPILPIVIMYAAYGFTYLINLISNENKNVVRSTFGLLVLLLCFGYYAFFDWTLLNQFQKNTPKSASYLWMKENTSIENPFVKTLVYTEEGLDPLNKLPYADVYQYNVYEGSGASLFLPQNPNLYKYVILSSRPMENFKRLPVMEKYPEYSKTWIKFENLVTNSENFKLIKTFNTTRPNLIPLSEVYIYENTNL